jgi:uncharacterized protein YeaO (DUF488 family)
LPLKTKSIYEAKEASDGVRVLITRYYPRGIKKSHFDLWLRHASPETTLLKSYKSGKIGWKEFSKEFKKQMRASPDSKEAIEELVELLKKEETVSLLCYEKEGLNCHRYLVKELVDSALRRRRKKSSGPGES